MRAAEKRQGDGRLHPALAAAVLAAAPALLAAGGGVRNLGAVVQRAAWHPDAAGPGAGAWLEEHACVPLGGGACAALVGLKVAEAAVACFVAAPAAFGRGRPGRSVARALLGAIVAAATALALSLGGILSPRALYAAQCACVIAALASPVCVAAAALRGRRHRRRDAKEEEECEKKGEGAVAVADLASSVVADLVSFRIDVFATTEQEEEEDAVELAQAMISPP